MNPHIYDEYRLGRRRFREYYAKTLGMGVVALLLAVWFGSAHLPQIGPGIYASAGFSAAGLLLLWGLRNMHRSKIRSRWAHWLRAHTEASFPAILILFQGWFLLLIAMLIWFTIADLGFAANTLQNVLLLVILLFIPVRRILAGTASQHPSPRRELTTQGLTYLNVAIVTLFLAAAISGTMLPPQEQVFSSEIPMGAIIIWLSATLVILTCLILFLDHIVRKMPPAPKQEEQDTLD